MFLPSTAVPRRLLLWSREKGEWEAEEASPEMCTKMWKNARSRSPRKRSAPMSADAAEEPLAEEAPSLFDSGYLGADDTTEYAVHYDGELGPAEPHAEEEPRGRSRKRRLSLEDEEQDGRGSGRSRLRRKMSKMVADGQQGDTMARQGGCSKW